MKNTLTYLLWKMTTYTPQYTPTSMNMTGLNKYQWELLLWMEKSGWMSGQKKKKMSKSGYKK
jgi:hypothetical protein